LRMSQYPAARLLPDRLEKHTKAAKSAHGSELRCF
jgi:hypothetical protein